MPADRRGEENFPLQPMGTNIAMAAMAGRGMAAPVTRGDDRRTGREWAERPRAFVLDEPTRGVDVGAKTQMYDLIAGVAERGAGVIVISSELSELITLCARIGVITRGRLVGVYSTTSVDEQRIVDLAIGGQD